MNPINDLTDRVVRSIIEVHKTLGPGFLESVYRKAFLIELRDNDLRAETGKEVPVGYKGREVGLHRLDILVEGQLIIELKTVEDLSKAHYAQVRSYLKATGLPVALLVNFSKE